MDNLNNNLCKDGLSNYKDLLVYQYDAARTINTNKCTIENLKEYAVGIGEEAGEAAGVLKKFLFHGHELNREKLIEELGDNFWHIAAIAELTDIPLSEIANYNIKKLKLRYPNGFEIDKSINREV